ncbi:MAG: lipocalin family protein [Bacteroidaceae bacterium]|nr:lipocalin family protein [Bacteroidaceae bacterium]
MLKWISSIMLFAIIVAGVLTLLFSFKSAIKTDAVNNTPTATRVDLDRYLGKWYEIARYDHAFEKGMTHCTAQYSLKTNGKIKFRNNGIKNGKYRESEGIAKTTAVNGRLRVSFFRPFYSDYRILMLAPDYSYVLVGGASSRYLWILSRTPELPQETIADLLWEARGRGYDTSKLVWVSQK